MVKMRLLFVDEDEQYAYKFTDYLMLNHSEDFEIACFTDQGALTGADLGGGYDFALVCADYPGRDALGSRVANVVYLTDQPGVDQIDGHPALFKYQKASVLYKQLLGFYSEFKGDLHFDFAGEGDCRTVAVMSTSGGCGASTIALAIARSAAAAGSGAVYLSLEDVPGADAVLDGDGAGNLSDVLYAVRTAGSNLDLKLESLIKRDRDSGVSFFSSPYNLLDLCEIQDGDLQKVAEVLCGGKRYGTLVLDLPGGLRRSSLELMQQADVVVLVTNPTDICAFKTARILEGLAAAEEQLHLSLLGRVRTLTNKSDRQMTYTLPNGKTLPAMEPVPFISGASTSEVAARAAHTIKL